MMKPPAPMIGGMNMPPMEAAGSMAPATCGLKPAFFISGMVKAPVETVLAMADPETEPKKPEAITATLAGPPTRLAGQGHGQVEEEAAGAGEFQERAEEDEQDDVGHQDGGHDAEDALLFVVDVVQGAVDLKAGVGKASRTGRPWSRSPQKAYTRKPTPTRVMDQPSTRRATSREMRMPRKLTAVSKGVSEPMR